MITQGVSFQLLLILSVLLFAGCNHFPKDPEKTLQSIRGKKIRVGITENKPWTDLSDSIPKGIEVQLVEAIAQDLDAEIRWKQGSESELIEALKAHEIDLLIGGLSKKTPWAKEVGLTRPYQKTIVYVGVPEGTPIPEHIRDREVGVKEGSVTAKYVKEKGGNPIRVNQLEQFKGLVAGYDWELKQMGLQISDIKLHEDQKVWAVPRGENAWVMYLETFFDGHKREIDHPMNPTDR